MKKIKILIVEDDQLVRESLQSFLENLGYLVNWSDDAISGLSLYQSWLPDIVLCDLHLPIVNGLVLFQNIKNINPDVAFIIISGVGDIDLAAQAINLGAWDYLTKPITDFSRLTNSINRAHERMQLIAKNKKYKKQIEIANQNLRKNLNTLEEDQKAGRQVQRNLFPKNNIILNGMKFSYFVKPSLYLTGDFLDYIEVDKNYTCFYLADVSGHGAASAFITVLLKLFFHQTISEYNENKNIEILEPKNLLARLNNKIYEGKLGKYATIIYGIFNKSDRSLKYSVNAHLPYPILWRHGENIPHYLEHKGFPIGIFSDAKYETYSITLKENFCLVMFSDGIFEIFDEENTLSEKENNLLAICSEKLPDLEAIESLVVKKYKFGPPDDIACLLVRSLDLEN